LLLLFVAIFQSFNNVQTSKDAADYIVENNVMIETKLLNDLKLSLQVQKEIAQRKWWWWRTLVLYYGIAILLYDLKLSKKLTRKRNEIFLVTTTISIVVIHWNTEQEVSDTIFVGTKFVSKPITSVTTSKKPKIFFQLEQHVCWDLQFFLCPWTQNWFSFNPSFGLYHVENVFFLE
jgi:membrane-associated HD superfamily phosphohydrolase